jgi:hypothetical protein
MLSITGGLSINSCLEQEKTVRTKKSSERNEKALFFMSPNFEVKKKRNN